MHGPHPPPGAAPTSVQSYEHVSQLGRDQQMNAVVRGFLSLGPPGDARARHDAGFHPDDGERGAYLPDHARGACQGRLLRADPGPIYFAAHLFQTATLTVLQQEVRFEGADTPFRTLRLAEGRIGQVDPKVSVSEPFWVTRGGADVRFGSWPPTGRGERCPSPHRSCSAWRDVGGDSLEEVFRSGDAGRRQINLGGMPVALADRTGHNDVPADAVTLPVHSLEFELA